MALKKLSQHREQLRISMPRPPVILMTKKALRFLLPDILGIELDIELKTSMGKLTETVLFRASSCKSLQNEYTYLRITHNLIKSLYKYHF
jgi:hypothetical protein